MKLTALVLALTVAGAATAPAQRRERVRDAVIEWYVRKDRLRHDEWSLPVVAETWDGGLNDINGFHVTKQDAWAALDSARGGPVVEGNVGGGTGMVCNQFKGGIGTASRRLETRDGGRSEERRVGKEGRRRGSAEA